VNWNGSLVWGICFWFTSGLLKMAEIRNAPGFRHFLFVNAFQRSVGKPIWRSASPTGTFREAKGWLN